MTTEPHYLAIDIETAGPNRAVFAIGIVLFKIADKQMVSIEERLFNYNPILPTTQEDETEEGITQKTNYGDFDMDTWEKFWNKHTHILDGLSNLAEYTNEQTTLDAFYTWWITTTKKYYNLRIVSDNPAFDIGYLDSRIAYHRRGKTAKPLAYQWRGKNWYYVAPLDQFSLEWIIGRGDNGKECLAAIYQMCPVQSDHNPTNDAKKIGWEFVQLVNYFS